MERLIQTKETFSKKYYELTMKLHLLRTEQENTLTDIIKEAQTSEEGIDIKDLNIKVELDGNEPLLVYAIRVGKYDGDSLGEYLEIKVNSSRFSNKEELEWMSIYDFYYDTAEKILSEIMENL